MFLRQLHRQNDIVTNVGNTRKLHATDCLLTCVFSLRCEMKFTVKKIIKFHEIFEIIMALFLKFD